jgi:hypothetical protein
VDVCRPKPRTLDELELYIRITVATVPLDFLKVLGIVSSRLRKFVQNTGACV